MFIIIMSIYNPDFDYLTVLLSKEHHNDCQKIMNLLLQFGESKVESPFHARRASTIPTSKSTTGGEDCTQHAQPGMSIGIPNSSAGSSTLGESS